MNVRAERRSSQRMSLPGQHRLSGIRCLQRGLAVIGAFAAAAAMMGGRSLPVQAASTTRVAYVYDEPFNGYSFCSLENPAAQGINDPRGPGCGASLFVNALTGTPPPGGVYNGATYVNVPVPTVDAGGVAAFSGFDTVVVYQVCDIASHPNTMTAINTFLSNGGKVIILDGDRCAPGVTGGGLANYSTFVFPFATSSPGPRGASGSYTFVEPNTMTTGLAVGPQPGDSVGDANVFTTFDPAWCNSISGTNTLGATGIIEAYAFAPAGGGLAIYEGEDLWFTFGPAAHLKRVYDNIQAQAWNPSGLPCGHRATGITLSPASATNPVGGSHTVTANVSDPAGSPSPGVTVTFSITAGPNVGRTGTAVTDASGNATFTYTDTGGAGTDSIVASFTDTAGRVRNSNVASKTWTVADRTPPSCDLTAVIDGPPKQIQVTVQDPDGGLQSIEVTDSTNATVSVPPFTVGTLDPVVVTGTKIDQSSPSSVGLKATDVAGNVTFCDPTLLSVGNVAGEKHVSVTLAKGEGKVTIHNGSNGIRNFEIDVNGKTFALNGLADGQVATLDIRAALTQAANHATISGSGPKGSEATVVIST